MNLTTIRNAMFKKAAEAKPKNTEKSEKEYNRQRSQTVSSANKTLQSQGMKPMSEREANATYDQSYAAAARKRTAADQQKRQEADLLRQEMLLNEQFRQLETDRYMNSPYGRSAKQQRMAQLRAQQAALAQRRAAMTQSTGFVAANSNDTRRAPAGVQAPARNPQPAKTMVAQKPAAQPKPAVAQSRPAGQKRAPGIYNAQGQKWNGSGWEDAQPTSVASSGAGAPKAQLKQPSQAKPQPKKQPTQQVAGKSNKSQPKKG